MATNRGRKVIPLKKRTRKVIPFTAPARRREALALVRFIDEKLGGKLAPFRAYRPSSPPE